MNIKKEESLNKRLEKIRTAFDAQYSLPGRPDMNVWVVEVFGDYLIGRISDQYWQVGYEETSDGIQFADRKDWQEVEERREWAAKWAEHLVTLKAVTKAETDGDHPASHYLVVEDPKKPTTWHLRVKDVNGKLDHGLMGAAWAACHGGYRDNKYEGPNKREAIARLKKLYEREGMELPSEKSLDDTLVAFGGAVKALGNGKIGGYLVRFGAPWDTDIEDDYFTPATDYGLQDGRGPTHVYYNHGLNKTLGKRRLADGALTTDDVGVWVETELALRDAYEQAIYAMAEAGKLGWSSGTAAHLVEREAVGKAQRVTMWPLGLDASLTPAPAEPRNRAVPLKSLDTEDAGLELEAFLPQGGGEPSQDAAKAKAALADARPVKQEEGEMGELDAKALMDRLDQIGAKLEEKKDPAELKSLQDEMAVLKARLDALESEPPAAKAGFATVKAETQPAWKSLGEQLQAVYKAAVPGGSVDARLATKASGLSEGVPSEGGFLVDKPLAAELLKRTYETGVLVPRVRRIPIGPNANGVKINAIDETSRAAGSRWGGVQVYWLAEAGTKTATKPKFRQIQMELQKVAALCYATDELLQDAVALEGVIREAFPEEMNYELDRVILRGSGAGQPLGILNAGCLVTVAKETGQAATTVVTENIVKMWSRCWGRSRQNAVWLINQDIEPQLYTMSLSVGTGGVPVYMPAGGVSGQPYSTLFGRPVIPHEECSTLGTVGDIVLADFSQYLLIDKGGVGAESSIHVRFIYDETTFRFVYRVDGQPAWNSALTPAQGSNTLSPFVVLAARA